MHEPLSGNSSDPVVAVCVCSAQCHSARRKTVRETWMRNALPHWPIFFFLGSDSPAKEEDVLSLAVADSYAALPRKMSALFQHALNNLAFDYLFKCDDDTYVHLARLANLSSNSADFIGSARSLSPDRWISGGAGYMLSRKMVEIMASVPPPERGPEDVWVHETLHRAGYPPHRVQQLTPDSAQWPERNNVVVTSHWCSTPLMQSIYLALQEPPAPGTQFVFQAVHRSWQGIIYFHECGIFTGGAFKPNGEWDLSPDGERLTLRWFYWPEQILRRTQIGFEDVRLKLTKTHDCHI